MNRVAVANDPMNYKLLYKFRTEKIEHNKRKRLSRIRLTVAIVMALTKNTKTISIRRAVRSRVI